MRTSGSLFTPHFEHQLFASLCCLFLQVVLEREIGLRPLLRTAGLRSFPFWLGTWLGDALFMAITYQLVYMLGYSFRRTPFLKPASPVMLVLNILAPKAQLLMVYVWTYNMKNGLAAASNMSVLFFMMAALPYFFMLTIWADGGCLFFPRSCSASLRIMPLSLGWSSVWRNPRYAGPVLDNGALPYSSKLKVWVDCWWARWCFCFCLLC
jgi:hypothetical protein